MHGVLQCGVCRWWHAHRCVLQVVVGAPLCAAVWCVLVVGGRRTAVCCSVVCAAGGRRTAVCCIVVCAAGGRRTAVCCSVVCAAGGRRTAVCPRLRSTVCGARRQPAFVKWNRWKWRKESACVVSVIVVVTTCLRGVAEHNIRDTPKVVVGLWCVPLYHPVVGPFSRSIFAENSEGKHVLTCQSRLLFYEL